MRHFDCAFGDLNELIGASFEGWMQALGLTNPLEILSFVVSYAA